MKNPVAKNNKHRSTTQVCRKQRDKRGYVKHKETKHVGEQTRSSD